VGMLSHETAVQVTLVWVPSHIGIPGNEKADVQAGKGVNDNGIRFPIGMELADAYALVNSYICQQWQSEWTNATTGRFYHQIEPNVKVASRLKFANRSMETMAHRLRFGKCCLNLILHKISCHDNGLCDDCRVPESIQHHVLECSGAVASAVREVCGTLGIPPNVAQVLGNVSKLAAIHKASANRRL
jgi:hypothetical protein